MNFYDRFGYTDFFSEQVGNEGLAIAKVTTSNRQHLGLATETGDRRGEVSGRFSHMALGPEDYPCVGDWVLAREAGDGPMIVERVLDRKTCVKRKAAGTSSTTQLIATNVDTIFIVQSCNQDLNLRRLERYIVACRQDGTDVVVVFNKADLISDHSSLVLPETWQAESLVVSAEQGDGMDAFAPYLAAGKTSVFVGSSGVGKSTIINRLSDAQQVTQGIREGDDRGRHTTTGRELFFARAGGMIIDTPGMREFGLIDTELDDAGLFDDIDRLAESCQFRNCGHQGEPGCAVLAAIDSGELQAGRLQSLRKLQREEEFQRRREGDRAALANSKKKWREISKKSRKLYKSRR